MFDVKLLVLSNQTLSLRFVVMVCGVFLSKDKRKTQVLQFCF